MNSTNYVQFAASKLHHYERLQWTQHIIKNSIQQPSLNKFSQWVNQIALVGVYLSQEHFTSSSSQPSSSGQQRNSEPRRKKLSRQPVSNTQREKKTERRRKLALFSIWIMTCHKSLNTKIRQLMISKSLFVQKKIFVFV